ncbi:M20/M25/M40 family metallo-hydrolase [Bacteroidota bacterium]
MHFKNATDINIRSSDMKTNFAEQEFSIKDIDWNIAGEEAVQILQSYIQINTSNPPGNEEKGALFLKDIFDKEGIENEIIITSPGRACFRAVLKGGGKHKPLLLLNHIDVVSADEKKWKVPPFSGIIKDGYIWGRGALDMKSTAVTQLMALILLKRKKYIPDRDIIFLAVADEELGGKYGVKYLMDNHFNKIDAGFVLNEGGTGITKGRIKAFMIESSQKSKLLIKLSVIGKLSHSSNQKKNDASQQLVKALNKIFAWKTPVSLTKTTKLFFRNMGATYGFPNSFFLKNHTNPLLKALVLWKIKKDEYFNLLIRDSISLTKLHAGNGELVIPDEACAWFDCRLLPGRNSKDFIDDLKKLISDESVKIEILSGSDEFINKPSPINTALFEVISSVLSKNLNDFVITPVLIPGTSDSIYFRKKGITSYGFQPFVIPCEDMRGYHNINERISVANIHLGVKMMTEVITQFTGT